MVFPAPVGAVKETTWLECVLLYPPIASPIFNRKSDNALFEK